MGLQRIRRDLATEQQQLGKGGIHGCSVVKNLPANAEDAGSICRSEDPLEKEMATHSSILAWEIPRPEEPGGLLSTGSQKSRTWLSDETATVKKSGLPNRDIGIQRSR